MCTNKCSSEKTFIKRKKKIMESNGILVLETRLGDRRRYFKFHGIPMKWKEEEKKNGKLFWWTCK